MQDRPVALGALPGYAYSKPFAINNSGQVAGIVDTGRPQRNGLVLSRAFLWQSGQMRDLS